MFFCSFWERFRVQMFFPVWEITPGLVFGACRIVRVWWLQNVATEEGFWKQNCLQRAKTHQKKRTAVDLCGIKKNSRISGWSVDLRIVSLRKGQQKWQLQSSPPTSNLVICSFLKQKTFSEFCSNFAGFRNQLIGTTPCLVCVKCTGSVAFPSCLFHADRKPIKCGRLVTETPALIAMVSESQFWGLEDCLLVDSFSRTGWLKLILLEPLWERPISTAVTNKALIRRFYCQKIPALPLPSPANTDFLLLNMWSNQMQKGFQKMFLVMFWWPSRMILHWLQLITTKSHCVCSASVIKLSDLLFFTNQMVKWHNPAMY